VLTGRAAEPEVRPQDYAPCRPGDVDSVSLDPIRDGHSAAEAARHLRVLPEELSRVPAVAAVSWSGASPLAWFSASQPISRVSASDDEGRKESVVQAVCPERIGAHCLATLGAPLLSRR
jgi:hypothetical protein